MPAPIIAGVTFPPPSAHSVQLVPVSEEVQLADGSVVRYHRGHRTRITLRWRNVRQSVRDAVAQVARTRGVTQFVDIDGTPYVVLVDDSEGIDAVAATDPVRYDVGVTVIERRPR